MAATLLTQMEGYAAGALFALALRQAQIHQIQPLGWVDVADGDDDVLDRHSSSSSGSGTGSSEGDDGDASAQMWTHKRRGLLRPVFRFLEIEPKAWPGLEETAASSSGKHHIGAFLRMLFEESDETPEMLDQQLALRKAVDAMALSWEATVYSDEETREEHYKYEYEHHQKVSSNNASAEGATSKRSEGIQILNKEKLSRKEGNLAQVEGFRVDKSVLTDMSKKGERNIAVLYELLSACVADLPEDGEEHSRQRKGYDARHRVALRLLATWFDIKWIKMEAMEIMVACSAIAAAKEADAQTKDNSPSKGKWSKWKRGGIIGAAALTGGTLLAITGGLAAPAIAAGFSALAPTLGTLVPVIGASGFAAAASAAGSVAGSVAVAASFGAAGAGLSGSKMARRIGSVEEFEFLPIGENHKQGRLSVTILVSGFIFEKADFVKPWEGGTDGSERYAIQWETKNLAAVSNAIQDWLTSRLTLELMKQGAMMTVLSALVTALAWPAALLSATDFIDGNWTIAIDRSDKAGELLADALLKGLQGNRPVTLVGFSLGARLIFKCLQYLAENGDNEGIIERVVLLGAPISLKDEPWESARRMVAGRFVNVYSTNDWILGVTFRASLLTKGLAGIQPVDVAGVENVDVTELIDGHSSYLWTAHQILDQLELDTYYPVFSCSAKSL